MLQAGAKVEVSRLPRQVLPLRKKQGFKEEGKEKGSSRARPVTSASRRCNWLVHFVEPAVTGKQLSNTAR